MSLDLVGLQKRRLEWSRCEIERDRASLRQHFERSLIHAVLLSKVAVDPIVERRCLADVQDVATRTQHAVDAGMFGERQACLTRHRPDATSTLLRIGRCGKPVAKRAPCSDTLALEPSLQFVPKERGGLHVIGAATQDADSAAHVSG